MIVRFGAWLSLVERLVRDQEAGGSNPLAPTKSLKNLGAQALRQQRGPEPNLGWVVRALQKSGRPAAQEIQALLKRFSEVRDQLRKQEDEEARHKLVEK